MNSHEILKRLNMMVNDRRIPSRTRQELRQVIVHIKLQGEELQTLKDDITDMTIPDEDN